MRVPLQLPATLGEIGEAFAKLDAISSHDRTVLTDVISPIKDLNKYLRTVQPDEPADMEKLNQMAGWMEGISEQEENIFAGALDSNVINGLNDVLHVAGTLSEYTIIQEVTSDRELGGYLIEHGYIQCPKEVLPYLDYVAIGAEFYADHGGAYERSGYVVRKSELPMCLQKFHEPEPWRDENRAEIFHLKLKTSARAYDLVLPADEEYLEQVCRYLGIDGFAEAELVESTCAVPYLSDLLPMDCINTEDANDLAVEVEQMQEIDGELLKFCAVLAVEQPQNFIAACQLARDLDAYERMPDDMEAYGITALERIGADEEIINAIDGYMDFYTFGKAVMIEDDAKWTEFGLIRRQDGPFPEGHQGMRMM